MSRYFGTRARVIVAVLAGLGLFVAANVQLLQAALGSQPDCVPHLQATGPQGQFHAAKPSC